MIKIKTNLQDYRVELYKDNKLICSAISNNGYCFLDINSFGGYLLKIFVGSTFVIQSSIFYSDDNYIYVIYINQQNNKKVILKLTDHNYNGLRIEKGNLFLWHIISK